MELQVRKAAEMQTTGRIDEAASLLDAVIRKSPGHLGAHHRLGTIRRQQGRLDESLALLRKAVELNASFPDALNSLGNTLQALGRHEEAMSRYERALALRPEYPDAHNNLGNSYKALGKLEEAVACYRKAIAMRPSFEAAHSNLGNALTAMGRPDEAMGFYERALALRPDLGMLHSNLGTALLALNRHGEAAERFERARELDSDLPQPQLNLAMARLALGEYERGWADFEARSRSPQRKQNRREYAQPCWDGRVNLAGKTILVYFEQGIGDTLQFARYVPLLARRGARVIFEVQKPLLRLFQGLEGAAVLLGEGESPPVFDYHAPLLSLPLMFGTTLDRVPAEVPYLRSQPVENAGATGLCWAGNPGYANDHNRSIPLAKLAPVLDVEGARFVSLQRNLRAGDEEILAWRPNVDGEQDQRGRDLADTAALIAGLDLVITVDTAVAHLAGALGRDVWVLLPFSAHWAWLRQREDSPWYPTARLFRQPRIGDWESVADRVAEGLHERLSGTLLKES